MALKKNEGVFGLSGFSKIELGLTVGSIMKEGEDGGRCSDINGSGFRFSGGSMIVDCSWSVLLCMKVGRKSSASSMLNKLLHG